MIPYIHVPDLKLGPLTLHPFGLLVATGVIIGTWLATWRARQRGLDVDKLNSFITWMLVAGFMGGHMLDEIFYHPAELIKRPWSLFLLWEGLSSFGGFTGALIGIVLWKYFEALPGMKFRRREVTMPILPFADLILSVFPVAWIFGRSGCSVVHDHPGMRAEPGTLLAVAFGRPVRVEKLLSLGGDAIELRWGNAPQFDLGLLELMFTVVLAGLLALTWRRKLPTGAYVAATALAYAPVRFVMDFLRVRDVDQADPRYGGLTPAQWACVALFVFGLVMAKRARDIKASGRDPMDLVTRPEVLATAPEAAQQEPA
ncbi:Prolipoprotein diacylglyceryl transferase [Labilithrix luteola]|uniref:Prolipoprotein diacylglyceryl transferase n=1 Tax=Labilithrix luteola TaxID=1391654 RepID=A0A0K1Q7X0_9BACT|nr:prolipoprotein diacylglyceryl transferase family protein [Labilithrix luteola]AKV01747.1 Prolipoprotein diacylglyceryl transferase [Labilithrix luteola]